MKTRKKFGMKLGMKMRKKFGMKLGMKTRYKNAPFKTIKKFYCYNHGMQ
jgi:hypothetical protein